LFLAACGVDEPAPSATNGGGDTAVSPISFTAAQSVAEAASLRDHDHTHGAADPVVTIIEYGDFQ
jgi:hypothetical protein